MKERSIGNTVLVVDGGGRGAALVDKYAQSESIKGVSTIKKLLKGNVSALLLL